MVGKGGNGKSLIPRRGEVMAVSLFKSRTAVRATRLHLNGPDRSSLTVVGLSDGTVSVVVRFRPGRELNGHRVARTRSAVLGFSETVHAVSETERRCGLLRKVEALIY